MKIYKLIKDDEVIYVGRTILDLNRRKNSNFYKIPRDISMKCDIVLIEETDDKSRERYWIDYYRSIGCDLYNKRGGDFKDKNEAYYFQKLKQDKKRKKFIPLSEDEKTYRKKKWREDNKDELNRKKREKYANGDSWYHRKLKEV